MGTINKIQQNLESLLDHMAGFIWLTDAEFKTTFVNPPVENILCTSVEDFIRTPMVDLLEPQSLQLYLSTIEHIKKDSKNKINITLELVFNNKSNPVTSRTTIIATFDDNAVFDGLICITKTGIKYSSYLEHIQENEANLIAQIDNTPDSIWSLDNQYCIKTLNSSFFNYFKVAFGVALKQGTNILDQLPDPFKTIWKDRYNKCLLGEHYTVTDHFEFENVPQYVEVSFNPIFYKTAIIGVSCFSRDITQPKLIQKRLEESTANLISLIENTEARIWSIDTNFNIISVNSNFRNDFKQAFGFVLEKGVSALSNLPESLFEEWKKRYTRVLSGEKYSIIKEFNIEGVPQFVEVSFNPIFVDKKPVGATCYSRDISAQTIAERALKESEDKFRSIIENSNSSISIQTDNKILLVNKAWERITGYSAEEAKTLDPRDLVHPHERENMSELTDKRLRGEDIDTNYLFHLMDKTFNEKWIDLTATLIDFDGITAILINGNDITERKKAELELNKFSTGIMNSPSSIVITDIDGNIEYVNPFFTEFTGYTYEEAIGNNPRILNSGKNSPAIFTDLWSTILRGEVWNGEFLNKKKNGELYWESARIAPIIDLNGIITNFVAIKEDITTQKRTMELIEQSEKDLRQINAQKDKFFSIIAHDLRSPFSGLAGLTEILRTSYDDLDESQIKRYIELIGDSTQHVYKLLENLLAWAKTQTGKTEFIPKIIPLHQLIEGTISVLAINARSKQISLVNSVARDIEAFADENMLETVIRNLFSNAIKYTFKNGKIEISSGYKTINNKTFLIISVTDNGVGIPANVQNKLFKIEENYTTNGTEKEKGSGLGLILCKEFVEMHGGKIWCESAENNGSTFSFSLPVPK